MLIFATVNAFLQITSFSIDKLLATNRQPSECLIGSSVAIVVTFSSIKTIYSTTLYPNPIGEYSLVFPMEKLIYYFKGALN